METLNELYKRLIEEKISISDKGTAHDFIEGYYNEVFNPLKEKPIKLLEIGVLYCCSVRLWRHFFVNGEIWGLDIVPQSMPLENINYIQMDAYSQEALDLFEDGYFDIIIDDGPHTFESQMFFVEHWTKKLKSGGRLILEDIPSSDRLDTFHEIAKRIGEEGKVYDLRANKGKYDDIIFEIVKK